MDFGFSIVLTHWGFGIGVQRVMKYSRDRSAVIHGTAAYAQFLCFHFVFVVRD